MNYEKKYKEALERARLKRDEYKRLDGDKSFVPQDIESIFPELKESEDERIRKGIIKFIKVSKPEWKNYNDYSSWIAWLEKQGEVKESAISQHENITCKENGNSLTSEDERIRKEILYVIHQIDDNTTICGRNYDYQKWISWLEKQGETSPVLSNSSNIGKPAWSEEDELMLEGAIDKISDLGTGEMIKDWLKSLKDRVQPNH